MATKQYTFKKGGVQNAQKENPPDNSELQKAGNVTDTNNTKVTAYDFDTGSGKINDDSVEIYASHNFPSNEENPESCPLGEEQTSVQVNDEMKDTQSLQDKEEGSNIYDSVKTINREEKFENPVNEWASIINSNWKGQKSGEKMKELFKKYNPPRNCDSLKFPKTDRAVWKAFNKHKKKSDLKFIWIQKSLVKAASATLNLNDKILKALEKSTTAKEVEETKDIKTEILQNTADIIALLGHASNEICLKKEDCLKFCNKT